MRLKKVLKLHDAFKIRNKKMIFMVFKIVRNLEGIERQKEVLELHDAFKFTVNF